MNSHPGRAPTRAWVVTFAGTAVNLCLGILYAWSVWKAHLIATPDHPAGSPMFPAAGRRGDAVRTHKLTRLSTEGRPCASCWAVADFAHRNAFRL